MSVTIFHLVLRRFLPLPVLVQRRITGNVGHLQERYIRKYADSNPVEIRCVQQLHFEEAAFVEEKNACSRY